MSILMNPVKSGFRVDSFDADDLERVREFIRGHSLASKVRLTATRPIGEWQCAFLCVACQEGSGAWRTIYEDIAHWIIRNVPNIMWNRNNQGLYFNKVPFS